MPLPGRFPVATAIIPTQTPPMVAATLRSVQSVERWPVRCEASRLCAVFDGQQYDDRPYGWEGGSRSQYGSGAHVSIPAPGAPPAMESRKPAVQVPVAKVITQRYTDMVFGDIGFPHVECEDDQETDDFATAVVEAGGYAGAFPEMRDDAGACGTGVISWQWLAGKPRLEVHKRARCTVLDWANESEGVPLVVVKLWTKQEPAVDPESGGLIQQDVWYAREWSGSRDGQPGADRVYRYTPEVGQNPARWDVTAEVVISGECPVGWLRNVRLQDNGEGTSDYAGAESLCMAVDMAFSTAFGGTIRNADPTLCVHIDPLQAHDSKVRKGGQNVIFSQSGGGYIEMSGSGTAAAISVTDRARAFAFEACDMVMLDPEKIGGSAQSGEALRRLQFPTIKHADRIRTPLGKVIVRALRGHLSQAQQALAATPGADLATLFDLPPIVDEEGASEGRTEDGKVSRAKLVSSRPRTPGAGKRITLEWPEYHPDTAQDQLSRTQAVTEANGKQPIISQRTGIKAVADMFGITDVDQELADIEDGTRRMADANSVKDVATEMTAAGQNEAAQPDENSNDGGLSQ